MNKKIIIGGIVGLIVVIAIVLAILFLGKGKDKNLVDNQTNRTVDDTINELKDYTDLSEEQMREELNTVVDLTDRQDLVDLLESLEEPVIQEVLPDDENTDPDSIKYYGKDAEGNIIEVVDPIIGMTDEEAQAAIDKLDAAAQAAAEGDVEEYGRLTLEAEDLIPDVPPEYRVDQELIDAGFEAHIDEETGYIDYWNPNTVEDEDEDSIGFDFDSIRVDDSKTQTAEEAGYQPSRPEDIIYGN